MLTVKEFCQDDEAEGNKDCDTVLQGRQCRIDLLLRVPNSFAKTMKPKRSLNSGSLSATMAEMDESRGISTLLI